MCCLGMKAWHFVSIVYISSFGMIRESQLGLCNKPSNGGRLVYITFSLNMVSKGTSIGATVEVVFYYSSQFRFNQENNIYFHFIQLSESTKAFKNYCCQNIKYEEKKSSKEQLISWWAFRIIFSVSEVTLSTMQTGTSISCDFADLNLVMVRQKDFLILQKKWKIPLLLT